MERHPGISSLPRPYNPCHSQDFTTLDSLTSQSINSPHVQAFESEVGPKNPIFSSFPELEIGIGRESKEALIVFSSLPPPSNKSFSN